ncbi:hypothetical protein [Brevundimonas sp.]|uniref:hypothetical protein n=1 Tax=Brevundimonas sp. TaxID=1871086 RepID=UPI002BD55BDE|nr:hypothetical protein [Brevundimonas sp.]HWQ86491.1 hypothetical protein [Brevundimonas sp.]
MKRDTFPIGAIFGAPLVLSALSLIGLVGALLADGLWDGIGAGLLATTVIAIAWARFRRRRLLARQI